MKSVALSVVIAVLAFSPAVPLFAQAKQPRVIRHPAANAPQKTSPPDDTGAVYVLDGVPVLLELHHDTEVGTNKPVDVYQLVIEMQVMNSDGNLEPVGLQVFNYYTRWARTASQDMNPHNAADCRKWNTIITEAIQNRDPKSKTWPYLEFLTNVNARVLQTNEDGAVWFSDDIECWGASDRFPPF